MTFGYRTVPTSLHTTTTKSKKKLSYECYLYENIHSTKKNIFFFFDGVRKLYLKKIQSWNDFSETLQTHLCDHFYLHAVNYYDYDRSEWDTYLSHPIIQEYSVQHPLLACKVIKQLLSYHTKSIQNAIYNAGSDWKDYSILSISQIQVQLSFYDKIQQRVIDNESYSTFIGNKQPCHHYTIVPSYTLGTPSNTLGMDIKILESLCWRAYHVRKVFIWFIVASLQVLKTCELSELHQAPAASTAGGGGGGGGGSDGVPTDWARYLHEILSADTKKMLHGHEDYIAYQCTLQYISSSLAHSSAPAFPSTPGAPVTSTDSSRGHGYSSSSSSKASSPKPVREADRLSEEADVQRLMQALFHPPPEEESAEEGQQQPGQSMLQRLSFFLPFLSSRKLSFVMKCWQSCLRELQQSFDQTQNQTQTQNLAQPVLAPQPLTATASPAAPASPVLPLYHHQACLSLWDDVLSPSSSASAYPVLASSLVMQKVAMLSFACLVKDNEHNYYTVPGQGLLKSVKLSRRIPVTADVLAMQQHIARKYETTAAGMEQGGGEEVFLQECVFLPTLLKDMRAFHVADGEASLEMFLAWYGLPARTESGTAGIATKGGDAESVTVNRSPFLFLRHVDTMQRLADLWTQAISASTADQQEDGDAVGSSSSSSSSNGDQHSFSAQKEADKAILYLEKVPINSLCLELLIQLLQVICHLLQVECQHFYKQSDGVRSQLHHLQTMMNQLEMASLYIRKNHILRRPSSSSSNASSSSSQRELVQSTLQVLQQVESVLLGIEGLEHLLLRSYSFYQVVSTLHPNTPVDLSLGFDQGRYTLLSEDQAQEVRRAMKGIYTKGSGGHDWYSYDGRELGMPTARKFVIRGYYHGRGKVPVTSDAVAVTSSIDSPIKSMKLDFQDEVQHVQLGASESKEEEREDADVELVALSDLKQLRVAFIVNERS
jgi:hypothetical protein